MEMIGELHKMGYGKLKLYCYIKDGIGTWRSVVFSSDNWAPGPFSPPESSIVAWLHNNAPKLINPRQAAELFSSDGGNHEILQQAKGCDTLYVDWYEDMLKKSRPDGILLMEHADEFNVDGGGETAHSLLPLSRYKENE